MSHSLTNALVRGTLVLLVAFSVITWTVVLLKVVQYVRLATANRKFFRALGKPAKLPATSDLAAFSGPAARVAKASLSALSESEASDGPRSEDKHLFIENAVRQQLQTERRGLEGGLAVLASIGTTAPFVGLFGTVFGIIDALKTIGGAGSASIEVVAGPIGEALIATGIGIAVAVPALLAYNFFVRRTKSQSAVWESLATTLFNLGLKDHKRSLRSVEREVPFTREARV
ncbi:MAG: MotA/TolQ/ExbB proton channel family protein [Deltaproteobacteria bacterium]|nr:MotA/TolQ/ExbB proton channel family protein [Deltaproteobacteria bacterium]